jgi:RHS repeat-associated protein
VNVRRSSDAQAKITSGLILRKLPSRQNHSRRPPAHTHEPGGRLFSTLTTKYSFFGHNSNLTTRTDAKNQTITMVYDALNRLVSKVYPSGSGTANVYNNYDSTFGLGKSNNTYSETANRIDLVRFKNADRTGTLSSLNIKFNQAAASGTVRMGVYADNNGSVGSRLLDAGEVACGTGWVTKTGLNLSVTQNTYYWLAFTMSGNNTLEYQQNYGSNTLAGKASAYGALPSTLSGLTYSNNAFVFTAAISNGNYGKGTKTSMNDGSGSSCFKMDARGRLIEEKKTIDSTVYTTAYTYDGVDRQAAITYPTGEVVTNGYNGRGLTNTLRIGASTYIVNNTSYNALGGITSIAFNNGTTTNYSYWGIDHQDGANPAKSYGKLWEIKTVKSGSPDLQDVQHTWDNNGNLTQRVDVKNSQTENFTYDALDRLLSVSGAYSESFAYNVIGNILTKNGTAYSYGARPHAATVAGANTYTYDDNGNMLSGDGRTITWDVENRVNSVTKNGTTTDYTYDGDGNQVKKIVGGVSTIYVNRYYEKTGNDITTSYYLGGKMVATSKNSVLSYILQDHLSSTAATADSGGAVTSTINYYSFGSSRITWGTLPTDKKFTGQRADTTGLYYYGARYYDATIGRFISPDTMIPDPKNPQALNRFSYCFNNPLKYNDPSGHMPPGMLNFILQAYNSGFVSQEEVSYLVMINNMNTNAGQYTAMHEIAAINAAHELYMQDNQVELESNYSFISDRGKNTQPNYEIDIVVNKQIIYEVKPQGTYAENQISKYEKFSGMLRGGQISPIPNIPMIGDTKMNLESPKNGLIWYSFTSNGNKIKSPEVNKSMQEENWKIVFYIAVSILLGSQLTGTETIPAPDPIPVPAGG